MSLHIVRVWKKDYKVITESLAGNWFASGVFEGEHIRVSALTEQRALKRWKEGARFISIPHGIWIAGALAGTALYIKFWGFPQISFLVPYLTLRDCVLFSMVRKEASAELR
jgi:hypothetical protein